MLTRNWYKTLYGCLYDATLSGSSSGLYCWPLSGTYKNLGLVAYDGNICTSTQEVFTSYISPLCGSNNRANYNLEFTSTTSKGGVALGSGTTPATIDDYRLESRITSGLTGTVEKVSSYDSKGSKAKFTYTLNNTTNSPITISEIGWLIPQINSYGSGGQVLMDRTLLETPVTIEAGGVGKVEYVMELINPFEIDS